MAIPVRIEPLAKRQNKYKARRVTIDGIAFDSHAEARHYGELKLLQRAGEISELKVHWLFPLTVNGKKVGSYEADFVYTDKCGRLRVVDVKGGPATRTQLYRLKKKMFEAQYGLTIEEVDA